MLKHWVVRVIEIGELFVQCVPEVDSWAIFGAERNRLRRLEIWLPAPVIVGELRYFNPICWEGQSQG